MFKRASLTPRLASILSYAGKVGDGAWTERDYLFTLPDGRSLTIGMWALASGETAPSDAALTDFAAHVISTLRPRS